MKPIATPPQTWILCRWRPWIAVLLILAIFFPSTTFGTDQIDLLNLSDGSLRGCFGITADGVKMACFNKIRGQYSIEIKGTKDRRLYKAWPLSAHTEGRGKDAALTKILKELTKRGFRGLTVAEFKSDNQFSIPGYQCELGLTTDTRYVKTIAGQSGGPWVEAGGIGGKNQLAGVALDLAHSRIILTIDQHDATEETQLREYKIFPLSELNDRAECRAANSDQPQQP